MAAPKYLRPVPTVPTMRVLLRRSKDEGQEFSLDTQRTGCAAFGEQIRHRSPPIEWTTAKEYLDDGIAGDDFLGRAGLRQLMEDLKPGDVVVCRDHSRLGRDAIEVTLVVRQIVRDRNARLFYYASGQEVAFATAIDAAMTFVQGVGAQMELEAIRSRTREALRLRVRQGKIAGGACYGYTLVREADAMGRKSTSALINPAEAEIVRECFRRYIEGWGLKRIAIDLNQRRVPPPKAGRRGSGSWSPNVIREFIRRERYRGIYVHGAVDRVKRGGRRISVAAPPEKVERIDLPEWRIVDEDTWALAQARIAERANSFNIKERNHLPRARYMLSGLGRCEKCNSGIGVARTSRGAVTYAAYSCMFHHHRGPSVCDVVVYQPIHEIEKPLSRFILDEYITLARMEEFIADICKDFTDEQKKKPKDDPTTLQKELQRLKEEQRRYASAYASAPDVAELLAELKVRQEQIRQVEKKLIGVHRAPKQQAETLASVEAHVRQKWTDARATMARDTEGAREVLAALFPQGIAFEAVDPGYEDEKPNPKGGRPRCRKVWKLKLRPGWLFHPEVATPEGFEPSLPT